MMMQKTVLAALLSSYSMGTIPTTSNRVETELINEEKIKLKLISYNKLGDSGK